MLFTNHYIIVVISKKNSQSEEEEKQRLLPSFHGFIYNKFKVSPDPTMRRLVVGR